MSTTYLAGQPSSNYRVAIRLNGENKDLYVEAWLPENFSFGADANWCPFMVNGQVLKGRIGEFLQSGAQLLSGNGFTLVNQSATSQLYQGSGYISFTLDLEFIAETDPEKEVLQPIKTLMQMVSPRKAGGFLRSPVTYETASLTPKNYITLVMGNYFRATKLFCKGVQPTLDSMMNVVDGKPMRGRASVTLETLQVPTQEDILEWFYSGTGDTGNANPVGSGPTFEDSNVLNQGF